VTTYYPSTYFQKAGATSTSHIMANGQAIASVENQKLYFLHTDHLGGTNVMTDENAVVSAVYDYTPYGTMRVNSNPGPYTELKRYAGTEYDIDSQLNYMQARYQDRARILLMKTLR
jgi:uncharacterized protein RhaS with RHS repeats